MTEDKKHDYFQRQLTMIIGVMLAVILIIGVCLWLIAKDIKGNAERAENLRKELSSRFKITESSALLRRQSEQARAYLTALDSIVINRDRLVNFSHDINSMAKQNRLDLSSSFSGESYSTDKKFGKIGLSITAAGPLNNFIQFLKNVENSRYFAISTYFLILP